MVNFISIPQGKGATFDSGTSPENWVGTEGLAVCLGFYFKQGTESQPHVTVGHFDCNQSVRNLTDPNFDWVRNVTYNLLQSLSHLGPLLDIAIASTSRDPSTMAIKAGVERWAGRSLDPSGWMGFCVRTNGTGGFRSLTRFDHPTPYVGRLLTFSVPSHDTPG